MAELSELSHPGGAYGSAVCEWWWRTMGKKGGARGGNAAGGVSTPLLVGACVALCAVLYAVLGPAAAPPSGDWASPQLLKALQRSLWATSADAEAGLASEAGAVAALDAVRADAGPASFGAMHQPLLQLANLCQSEMRLRLLFSAISFLDKLTLQGSNVEMQHMVASAYKQAYPLLTGESETRLSEWANWLHLERAARLSPPGGSPGMPGGDVPKGEAVAASLLTSSSYWDGGALTIVRAMHQQPAGAEHWERLGWGIAADCRSLNATAVLSGFEGSNVHRRGPVVDWMESCIADTGVVETALSRGAKVGVANLLGWTALRHAALLGPRGAAQRLIHQLIEGGAQPTDRNGAGHTPLHVAAFRGAPQVVAVLLAAAPSLLNAKDKLQRSPSDLACLHKPALAGLSTDIAKWPDGAISIDLR